MHRAPTKTTPGLLLCRLAGPAGHLVRLDHPAAAHGLVDVHQGLEDRSLRLRVGELGVEERTLGVQHVQLAGVAFIEPEPRDAGILVKGPALPT
jgi:hypothetical protein